MTQQMEIGELVSELARGFNYDITSEEKEDKLYWDILKAMNMRFIKLDSPNYVVRNGSAKESMWGFISDLDMTREGINELAKHLGVDPSRFNNWLGSPQTRLARKDLDNVIEFLQGHKEETQ